MKGISIGILAVLATWTVACKDEAECPALPDAVETEGALDPGVEPGADPGVEPGADPGEELPPDVIEDPSPEAGDAGEESPSINPVPFAEQWSKSAHADRTAEAFTHWDEDDPAEVPAECAKCHSTPGFVDFLGGDGSAAGTVEKAVPVGTVVECTACHDPAAIALDAVEFPSGVEIEELGSEARCMTCHQGRESTQSVNAAIEAAEVPDADTPSDKLNFKNIHYFAAGATLFGGQVMGGYQYAGRLYDWRFQHVSEFDSCQECHDPHTLEPRFEGCAACHEGVEGVDQVRQIRMTGSPFDHDGDGNTDEGIRDEVAGLHALHYAALRAYAKEQIGTPITYDGTRYPYFFADTNDNDAVDEGEPKYPTWTARLLRGAYNYQYVEKDPGGYVHNGKYLIQLMMDSIEDLQAAPGVSTKTDLSKLTRDDPAHLRGSREAWRHWDKDGEVPGSCARCHSRDGVKFYVQTGGTRPEPPANGLACETCHPAAPDFSQRLTVAKVTFPSGISLLNDSEDPDPSFICMTCHQGRVAKKQIDEAIANPPIKFQNVHYLSAGATQYGTQAKVGYEYDGKTYAGFFDHTGADGTWHCSFCHEVTGERHVFRPRFDALCATCHAEADSLEQIRLNRATDYDGDGDTEEPLAGELTSLAQALVLRIQAVASASGTPIAYNPDAYPYFFKDTNGNGQADPDEAVSSNAFVDWTAGLLKAAHNYQVHRKEPGNWAHNTDYTAQLLIDSIEDLGGDVSGFNRP